MKKTINERALEIVVLQKKKVSGYTDYQILTNYNHLRVANYLVLTNKNGKILYEAYTKEAMLILLRKIFNLGAMCERIFSNLYTFVLDSEIDYANPQHKKKYLN